MTFAPRRGDGNSALAVRTESSSRLCSCSAWPAAQWLRKRSPCRGPMIMRRSPSRPTGSALAARCVRCLASAGQCRVRKTRPTIRGPEAVLWIDRGDSQEPSEPSDQGCSLISNADRNKPLSLACGLATGGNRLETPTWFGRLVTQSDVDLRLPPPQAGTVDAAADCRPGTGPIRTAAAQGDSRVGPPGRGGAAGSIHPEPCRRRALQAHSGAAQFRRVRVLNGATPAFRRKSFKSPGGERRRRHQRRRERHYRRPQRRRACRRRSARWARSTSKPTASWSGRLPLGAGPRARYAAERSAAGNLHGRQHRLPPGRPHRVRRPHVLRRPPAGRHDSQRRAAHAAARDGRLSVPGPGAAQGGGHPAARRLAVRRQRRHAHHQPLEDPAYSFESQTITLTDRQQPLVDPYTGMVGVNPATGEPAIRSPVSWSRAETTFCMCPASPCSTGRRSPPTSTSRPIYINNVRIRNDSIFGFQTLFDLDAFQLLGYEAPEGVEWDLNLDYLSQRGLGFGTTRRLRTATASSAWLGPTTGRADAWFINDHGLDNLGFGRRDIVPEKTFPRPGVLEPSTEARPAGWLDDWTVQGEVGLAQRPHVPRRVLRERMGRQQGPDSPACG